MTSHTEKIIRVALQAESGITPDQVRGALAILKNKGTSDSTRAAAVGVSQARVCDMLDCSRFHVRKLVRLGLLPQRNVGGLKRYAVADVIRLLEAS